MRLALPLALAILTGIASAQADPALDQALAGPMRSPKFVARDAARHPAEELAFFGIRPTDTVVEIWPGGGYWTEILAPYLMGTGTYYVALPSGEEAKDAVKFKTKIATNPAAYRHLRLTTLGPGDYAIAPPGSADLILTFRNLHNWMEGGYADAVLAAFYKALKPGGILGIEDHRASETLPEDVKADNGYVRQSTAIRMAEKAGFVLAGTSELDANPRDTKDYPNGVWTLPPVFTEGAKDHAKYAAIGEADNFILKFRKPDETRK